MTLDADVVRGVPGVRSLPRIPQLDGVRAVAISLVVCLHLSPQLFPGAFIGVDIFFVLSGFLITVVLLNSVRSDGSLSYRKFYLRRARRLLPAVSVLLIADLIHAIVATNGRLLLAHLITVAGAFLYVINWAGAFGHDVPWQMDHLWSLSVEEQFYLCWPVVLMFLVRRLPARRALLVTGGIAALSWVLRAAVWAPSREGLAYASTVTRADGLLLGCMLGQAYARRLCDDLLRALRRRAVGWGALAGILVLVPHISQTHAAAYFFSMGIAGIFSGLLIAHMVGDGTSAAPGGVARLLGARPVTALGRRAYSIYLWQNPIMFWLSGPLRVSPARWPVNIAATLICAELSYRLIERPFLRLPV